MARLQRATAKVGKMLVTTVSKEALENGDETDPFFLAMAQVAEDLGLTFGSIVLERRQQLPCEGGPSPHPTRVSWMAHEHGSKYLAYQVLVECRGNVLDEVFTGYIEQTSRSFFEGEGRGIAERNGHLVNGMLAFERAYELFKSLHRIEERCPYEPIAHGGIRWTSVGPLSSKET